MRKKILLSIGLCAVLALTACTGETDDLSVPESISGTSDIESDPAQENSDQNSDPSPENSDQNRDPAQGGYVQDEVMLSQISLEKDVVPDIVRMPQIKWPSDNLECKELFRIRSPQHYTVIRGIYPTETGFVISLSYNPHTIETPDLPDIPFTHYLWFDRDGKELDHVAFDLNAADMRIPDRDYPENGFFITPVYNGISKALYFRNGTLQKSVQLPQCDRSDFSPDKSQFLCIDNKRKNLILYDFKKDTAATVLPLEKFGYDDPWMFEFVRIVTPELATVTLFEFDNELMSGFFEEYEVNRRTYLLELPTLNILQQLPDESELTALGDGNFFMTKRFDKNHRSVFRAKLENGKIVETEETGYLLNETAQFHDRSNIILSPNKKVVLFRDWEDIDNRDYMVCYAASTDDLRLLWSCRVSLGFDIPERVAYMPAAITDDGVLYQFHFGYDKEDYFSVYRFRVNKVS